MRVYGPPFLSSEPKLKPVQISISWGMDQPVVVYPFNGIILTIRKKPGVHPTTCYTFKPVYKGKVSQAKDCRYYAPDYMSILKS